MADETAINPGGYIQLRLEADELALIASTGGRSGHSGSGALASVRNVLGQGRLTESGLESVITQVEDLVMPIVRTLPASTELKVSGMELAKVFRLMSATGDVAVPTEAVESLFNELADYAAGSPVAWRRSSSPGDVALGLVVLREVMHHGGFRSVSLLPDTE